MAAPKRRTSTMLSSSSLKVNDCDTISSDDVSMTSQVDEVVILVTPDKQLHDATPRRSRRLAATPTPSSLPSNATTLSNEDSSSSNYSPTTNNSDSESTNNNSSVDEAPPIITTPVVTKSTNKKRVTHEMETPLVDDYFSRHSNRISTSDNTLSKLKQPIMARHTLLKHHGNLLANHHNEHIQMLLDDYSRDFTKWVFHMYNGYNLLFYGVGSKCNLLDSFVHRTLSSFSYITVNGFFPSISFKQIMNCICCDIIGYTGSFRSQQDQTDFIMNTYTTEEDCPGDLFLLVHNIDGSGLRGDNIQTILSELATAKHIHIIASIDHINAPLLWDEKKLTCLNWLWVDITTLLPYSHETSYEDCLMVRQSAILALSSLNHVINSLTPNAQGIFHTLLKYQLQHVHDTSYTGMSLQLLYQRCRESFLVNTQLTLRSQLTEFRDHKLIRTKKGEDGIDMLLIPIDSSTLQEFIDESTSTN